MWICFFNFMKWNQNKTSLKKSNGFKPQLGWYGYVALCLSLIIIPAPSWLVILLEIIIYIGFIYHTAVWTVANIVVYGFIMYFSEISQVTDTQMRKFCIGISIFVTFATITLDYFVPQNHTIIYGLFGLSEEGCQTLER